MPFIPDYNALFIHIPKNAGRSVEEALLPAPLTPHSGKRSIFNRIAKGLLQLTAQTAPRSHLLGTLDVSLAAQHLTYIEIRMLGLLPRRTLEEATKFAVVRNPFDRVISSVLHFRNRLPALSSLPDSPSGLELERAISAWLEIEPSDHNLLAHRRPQFEFVVDLDGKLVPDRILRFERLEDDFRALTAFFGLGKVTLPWTGRQRSQRPWTEALTQPARKAVERAFEKDFELFYPDGDSVSP